MTHCAANIGFGASWHFCRPADSCYSPGSFLRFPRQGRGSEDVEPRAVIRHLPVPECEPPMRPSVPIAIWKTRYRAAILEIDKAKIPLRVRDAKMAIFDRAEELNGQGDVAERTALNRAMRVLNVLQKINIGQSVARRSEL